MQLKFTEDILPVTDFRNNAAGILNQLSSNKRPILLTQRGRASAVLLDINTYQDMIERLEEIEAKLSYNNANSKVLQISNNDTSYIDGNEIPSFAKEDSENGTDEFLIEFAVNNRKEAKENTKNNNEVAKSNSELLKKESSEELVKELKKWIEYDI